MSDEDRISLGNPAYENRYWMRVWIVAKAIALGWRGLPASGSTAWYSAKEFGRDFWMLLLNVVLPLTFAAAPVWLWLLLRDNKRQAENRKRRAEIWANRQAYDDEANRDGGQS